MWNILQITAPIYLLIALGFVVVKRGGIDLSGIRVLGRFVVLFCLPSLLFRALTQRSISEVVVWDYLLVYLVGGVIAALGVMFYARYVRRQPLTRSALWAMGSSMSNSAFIGYPVVHQLVGPDAAVALAMCMLVENAVIMPLCLAVADSGSAQGGGNWRVAVVRSARGLVRHPLILAIAAGLVFGVFDWHLPQVAGKAMDMLAAVASPVALFVVGGSLVGLRLGGVLRNAVEVSALKLLLHPAAVFLMLWLLPPLASNLHVAAVIYAAMPMVAVYPVLAQRYNEEQFCAAALMLATLSSFITLTLWMMAV